MAVTDQMTVEYPVRPDMDAELAKLTAAHPGIGKRAKPALVATVRRGRKVGRSIQRGWARVRGCLGSIAGLGTATTATFLGAGTIAGLIALAVSFVVTEWLLK